MRTRFVYRLVRRSVRNFGCVEGMRLLRSVKGVDRVSNRARAEEIDRRECRLDVSEVGQMERIHLCLVLEGRVLMLR